MLKLPKIMKSQQWWGGLRLPGSSFYKCSNGETSGWAFRRFCMSGGFIKTGQKEMLPAFTSRVGLQGGPVNGNHSLLGQPFVLYIHKMTTLVGEK